MPVDVALITAVRTALEETEADDLPSLEEELGIRVGPSLGGEDAGTVVSEIALVRDLVRASP